MSTSNATPGGAEGIDAAARHATVVIWTLYAVGMCVTALRLYARIQKIGVKRLQQDDYLVVLAALLYTAQTTLGYLVGYLAHGLANNGMTDAERAALSPTDIEYQKRVIGSKIQVTGWTVYSTLVTVLKLAMAVFFLRLTGGLGSRYRMRVYIGFGLITSGYVASIIAIFASCQPLTKYWQIHPNPGLFCYPANSPSMVWTSFVSNVLSDVYLILIPIPLLWSSRLRLLEKMLSTLVLGAGVFVLVCATVKTAFVVTDDENGAKLAGDWGTREAFVAVVVTNLPMVFPLVKGWLKPVLGSMLGSRTAKTGGRTPSGGEGVFKVPRTIGGGNWASRTRRAPGRSNRNESRIGSGNNTSSSGRNMGTDISGRRARFDPIMTDFSFADSEERIVMDEVKMVGDMGHDDSTKSQAVQVEVGVRLEQRHAEQGNQVLVLGQSQGQRERQRSSTGAGMGIVVSSEIEVYEGRKSEHHDNQHPARVYEPW